MGWIFILITAIMDVISSVLIKEWTLNDRALGLVFGIIALVFSGLTFAFAMKYFGLAIANVLWNSLSTILLAVIAIIFFHEKLSAIQMAGVLIVVLGVFLVGK